MSFNYDSSAIGVPYIRANNINVQYPTTGVPYVTVAQEHAVKLADGKVVSLGDAGTICFTINLADQTAIPLVDPTTGASLGPTVVPVQIMLSVLAAIRVQQLLQNV